MVPIMITTPRVYVISNLRWSCQGIAAVQYSLGMSPQWSILSSTSWVICPQTSILAIPVHSVYCYGVVTEFVLV